MRVPTSHRDEARESMAMTPMIDVVFLLLIFFVCASIGQIRELILATRLAAGGIAPAETLPPPEAPPPQQYWLYLKHAPGGRTVYEINNARFENAAALAQALSALAEWAAADPLILDIEPDVPAGDMIRVYDTARRAGFQSIQFAADAGTIAAPQHQSH